MPGRDGTGPNGMGPGTGRGMGPCMGNPTGIGFGRGRGYRRMACLTGQPGWMRYHPYWTARPADPADEKAELESQAQFLESQLNQIKERLTKLEG